jgi:hypothetical protein
MNMNKQELVDAIALAVGTSKSAAGETIDAFVAVVTQAVAEGDSVQLVGLVPSAPANVRRAPVATRGPVKRCKLRLQKPSNSRPVRRSRIR